MIRARVRLAAAIGLVMALALRLEAPPAIAGASLRLTDGRVLQGEDVRRDGDLYLLSLEGGSVVPVPVALVAEVGMVAEGRQTPPPSPAEAPAPGVKFAQPETLAGVPVTPPRTDEQLAVFGAPSRFQPDVVRSNLGPSYWVPDPAQNNWAPSKWAEAPIDSTWHPESAFDPNEDVLESSRSTFQKGPIDSTWVPQDGFKKSR